MDFCEKYITQFNEIDYTKTLKDKKLRGAEPLREGEAAPVNVTKRNRGLLEQPFCTVHDVNSF